MALKKSTTASAKTAKPAKPASLQKDHKHAELEKSIASLKKEMLGLKSQCANCCKELAIAKSEIESLKSAPIAGVYDNRFTEFLKEIKGLSTQPAAFTRSIKLFSKKMLKK